MYESELYHHGILGQKWGVRRYQNTDGTLTALGKSRRRNLDGSINETGKNYRDKYIAKQLRKTDRYYDRYTSKYQKMADKNADNKDIHDMYMKRKAEAERDRDSAKANIKKMTLEDVEAQKAESRELALRIAKPVAAVTGVALTAVGMGALGSAGVKAAMSLDYKKIYEEGKKYAELGLRYYTKVRSWATQVVISEVVNNIDPKLVKDISGLAGTAAASYAESKANGGLATVAGKAAGQEVVRVGTKLATDPATQRAVVNAVTNPAVQKTAVETATKIATSPSTQAVVNDALTVYGPQAMSTAEQLRKGYRIP